MKIAFDFVATNLGSGTKTYLINFCNNLTFNNKQHDITIYICKNYLREISSKLQKNPSLKFIIKPDYYNKTFFRMFWMQLILPFELRILKVKKLYSPMNIAPILCKLFKIRIILALHSNLPWRFFKYMPGNFFKKFVTKKMMEVSIFFSDILIVNSNYAKKEIIELLKLKNKKIFVVYLGLDTRYTALNPQINYLKKINYKHDYLLSVLSCVKYHNIINLLTAYKKILENHRNTPNYYLVMQILDEDYYFEINQFIKKNLLNDKVVILKNLSTECLVGLYRNAKLYIFSSYCEVFGLTTIEAMSQGCPVLVSDTSALPEINKSAVKYFDPDNPEEIKKNIYDIILNQDKMDSLKKKGIDWSKKFSWKKNTEETLEIIFKS